MRTWFRWFVCPSERARRLEEALGPTTRHPDRSMLGPQGHPLR